MKATPMQREDEDVSLTLYSKATCLYLVVVGKLSVIYTK